jgi:ribosomal protein S18 acetylase RimI-like enzyme
VPASREDISGFSLLDNPIWHALSTTHKSFAGGNDLAKRYPSEVTPLSAMTGQSSAAYDALREIVHPDDIAALFLDSPPLLPPNWILSRTFEIHQMIFQSPQPANEQGLLETLTEADIPQMLELTELTEPGPFRRRTIELGNYLGIFSPERRLAAMAGERLRLTGFTEISAVCTHPDHRGKGHARSLISALISNIIQRKEIPFLHVKADNAAAIGLYESLGFKFRTSLHLAVIKNAASSDDKAANP